MRGRFAPTPSGQLHVGNALTALLAWLQARRAGGAFVLRMEDIDRPRSRPHLAQLILEDLRWLGLDWDEGPDLGGRYGPYTQSERMPHYREALARLEEAEMLYPCYCSRAELHSVASAPHGLASEGPGYPGTCRHLSPTEVAERAAREKPPSLRFAMPPLPFAFDDLTAGSQQFQAGAGGDFVVLRADGIIAYQLAVVVDDAAMGITDVLRGWDLLDSTPRQLALYAALGLAPPRFAHVPLLVGPDGERLAKRHGGVAIAQLRAGEKRPEAVVGYLAYLSGLIARPEPVRPADLIAEFDLAQIPKGPVSTDPADLERL